MSKNFRETKVVRGKEYLLSLILLRMKNFLLLIILFSATSIYCFSQNNSDSIKRHRFWINPTQIVTGQYTLAYSHNIHGGNNWLEVGIGYRYFPFTVPNTSPKSNPKFGMNFTGPVISIASEEFHT